MPGSDDQYDQVHTYSQDHAGKSKTTKPAVREIGRDGAPVQLYLGEQRSEPRTPPSGVTYLYADSDGDWHIKRPDGTDDKIPSASGTLTDTGNDNADGGDIYQLPQAEDSIDGQGGMALTDVELINAAETNGVKNAAEFGDPSTDVGDSLQQAHDDLPAAGGVIVFNEPGTFPLTSTFTATKDVKLICGYEATKIELQANLTRAIDLQARFHIEGLRLSSDGSDTGATGVRVYDSPRSYFGHSRISDVAGDGLVYRKGNQITFDTVQIRSVGGDGFLGNTTTANNNAAEFENVYINDAAGTGLNLPHSSTANNKSRQHTGSITLQACATAVNIATSQNRFELFFEANTSTGQLTSNSEANVIVMRTDAVPTDNGNGNQILRHTTRQPQWTQRSVERLTTPVGREGNIRMDEITGLGDTNIWTPFGGFGGTSFLVVRVDTLGHAGMFFVQGNASVTEIHDPNGNFGTTADSGSNYDVYISNSELKIENNSGSTVDIGAISLGS